MRSTCCSNSGTVSPICATADTVYPNRMALSAKMMGNRPLPAMSPIHCPGTSDGGLISSGCTLILLLSHPDGPTNAALGPFDKIDDFLHIRLVLEFVAGPLDCVRHHQTRAEQQLIRPLERRNALMRKTLAFKPDGIKPVQVRAIAARRAHERRNIPSDGRAAADHDMRTDADVLMDP